jgi:hypothetical protein
MTRLMSSVCKPLTNYVSEPISLRPRSFLSEWAESRGFQRSVSNQLHSKTAVRFGPAQEKNIAVSFPAQPTRSDAIPVSTPPDRTLQPLRRSGGREEKARLWRRERRGSGGARWRPGAARWRAGGANPHRRALPVPHPRTPSQLSPR